MKTTKKKKTIYSTQIQSWTKKKKNYSYYNLDNDGWWWGGGWGGRWSLGIEDRNSYYDIIILISSPFDIDIDVYVGDV